jgi:hypothetical protein
MDQLSEWMHPHLHGIALAMIATILVIFGNDINRWVRKLVRKYNFIVRLLVFIVVCAAGYGIATVFLTQALAKLLGSIHNHYLPIVVAIIFLALGLTAEERNQM